jgi:hypothetical protein
MDFFTFFLPMIVSFGWSGKEWQAATDRERARRIAEANLNARLLRLNV